MQPLKVYQKLPHDMLESTSKIIVVFEVIATFAATACYFTKARPSEINMHMCKLLINQAEIWFKQGPKI